MRDKELTCIALRTEFVEQLIALMAAYKTQYDAIVLKHPDLNRRAVYNNASSVLGTLASKLEKAKSHGIDYRDFSISLRNELGFELEQRSDLALEGVERAAKNAAKVLQHEEANPSDANSRYLQIAKILENAFLAVVAAQEGKKDLLFGVHAENDEVTQETQLAQDNVQKMLKILSDGERKMMEAMLLSLQERVQLINAEEMIIDQAVLEELRSKGGKLVDVYAN